MKTVYILVGPKGSGKTYIGRLIEKNLGTKFLSVEPLFLKIIKNRDPKDRKYTAEGFQLIEENVDKILEKNNEVIIEQTGASEYFDKIVKIFKEKNYLIKLIKVIYPLEKCKERTKKRNTENQISVSEEIIDEMNKKSESLKLHYDLEINNENSSDEEIITLFRKII